MLQINTINFTLQTRYTLLQFLLSIPMIPAQLIYLLLLISQLVLQILYSIRLLIFLHRYLHPQFLYHITLISIRLQQLLLHFTQLILQSSILLGSNLKTRNDLIVFTLVLLQTSQSIDFLLQMLVFLNLTINPILINQMQLRQLLNLHKNIYTLFLCIFNLLTYSS
jgi:hypothetical protein